ncbi:JmjC domain-containing protein [Coccidioides immitis RS]|uniref:JmjC domain-containing protein n=4 Tax=Coccidioides immitis TaxID=5501 RepID=J3KD12_COCIM|nr:JmjC domain-containing protein [Coccidioides immitis RS]KMP08477.1 transcription factor [Coccidioides immitis RMSCC 2394]KMU72267.1 transcription factor [Coccidioides immitis RMSCC 3703]KMU87292.1 transcription factor [Coccidioides immitis H538.4]TPX20088.1 hypothetical protein DIZ76_017885 [Coccidioides immitis]EAS33183.3 JmjC domain-containing protein [Coccidioides immitis RS]
MKRALQSPPKIRRFVALNTLTENNSIAAFRESYFRPQVPVVLPRGQFRDLPAISRWFTAPSSISGDNSSVQSFNYDYLEQYGDCHVPLELTTTAFNGNSQPEESFKRFHAPLSLFLDWARSVQSSGLEGTSQVTDKSAGPNAHLYLAQCQLLDLAAPLRDDFAAPSYVTDAGKGDIYDTNVWIGIAPTYTPLHRDPNPNVFVQLAGTKHVRLLPANVGLGVFDRVRERMGRSGGSRSAALRGEDMMYGLEKQLLDQEIWGDRQNDDNIRLEQGKNGEEYGYEAVVNAGDGIFIPMGWWHSIKGVGQGITASVNWWFR